MSENVRKGTNRAREMEKHETALSKRERNILKQKKKQPNKNGFEEEIV